MKHCIARHLIRLMPATPARRAVRRVLFGVTANRPMETIDDMRRAEMREKMRTMIAGMKFVDDAERELDVADKRTRLRHALIEQGAQPWQVELLVNLVDQYRQGRRNLIVAIPPQAPCGGITAEQRRGRSS